NHRVRGPVLHRSCGVVAFELGEHDVGRVAWHALQPHERRVADRRFERGIHRTIVTFALQRTCRAAKRKAPHGAGHLHCLCARYFLGASALVVSVAFASFDVSFDFASLAAALSAFSLALASLSALALAAFSSFALALASLSALALAAFSSLALALASL